MRIIATGWHAGGGRRVGGAQPERRPLQCGIGGNGLDASYLVTVFELSDEDLREKRIAMWVPGSVAEIRRAVTDGIEESPWLDAKRELSTTAEVAKDVAAMANDGGVLLYGVGEDSEGTLSEVVPIESLSRVEERISNAVRDLIHNPPAIHVSPLEDSPGSRTGCLAVVVPRSPLAPHMVEGRRGGRYYGRVGTTTHQLTGAQVEQLLIRPDGGGPTGTLRPEPGQPVSTE